MLPLFCPATPPTVAPEAEIVRPSTETFVIVPFAPFVPAIPPT